MYKFKFCFLLLFLFSCQPGGKKEKGVSDDIKVEVEEVVMPSAEVFNLKSYYLSFVHQADSAEVLCAYNYKVHGLDFFNLKDRQSASLQFKSEGSSAVLYPVTGLFVQSADSIWIYDASQRAMLINNRGELLRAVNLREGLTDKEDILIDCNYAMSTSKLYYDKRHNSLLHGIKDFSTSPASFKVREIFLDSSANPEVYPLPVSVSVPDVAGGDYANMGTVNISYSGDNIICNYPAESHVYVLNRKTKQWQVIDGDSRFTKNVADKCQSSKDYSQWIRHTVENPHFYDMLYIPEADCYARLHLGEHSFDANQKADMLMDDRSLYLTLFDKDFKLIGETGLKAHRYNYYNAWVATQKGIILFVDNLLSATEKTENLVMDIIAIPKQD